MKPRTNEYKWTQIEIVVDWPSQSLQNHILKSCPKPANHIQYFLHSALKSWSVARSSLSHYLYFFHSALKSWSVAPANHVLYFCTLPLHQYLEELPQSVMSSTIFALYLLYKTCLTHSFLCPLGCVLPPPITPTSLHLWLRLALPCVLLSTKHYETKN